MNQVTQISHFPDVLRAALAEEYSGNFQKGLELLSEFWDYRNPELTPSFSGLSKSDSACLLLRLGALYGFYGISRRDCQERAKDLVTEAFILFDELRDKLKLRECANYLAVCYNRLGDVGSSRAWLDFSLHTTARDAAYFHAIMIETNNFLHAREFEIGRAFARKHLATMVGSADEYLEACVRNNLGIFERRLGDTEQALQQFEIAGEIFERIGNIVCAVSVLNNRAICYGGLGDLDRAIPLGLQALRLAESTGEERQIGCVRDTLAKIALDNGQSVYARHEAFKAVESLSRTEAYPQLLEAYETLIKCDIRVGDYGAAVDHLLDSTRIAEERDLRSLADRVKRAFTLETALSRTVKPLRQALYSEAVTDFTIVLPEGCADTGRFQIIEITSNVLVPHMDVVAGDLVVVVKEEFRDGDVVAVSRKTDGNVFFAKYRTDGYHDRMYLIQNSAGVFAIAENLNDYQPVGRLVGRARPESPHVKEVVVKLLVERGV